MGREISKDRSGARPKWPKTHRRPDRLPRVHSGQVILRRRGLRLTWARWQDIERNRPAGVHGFALKARPFPKCGMRSRAGRSFYGTAKSWKLAMPIAQS